MKKELIEEDAYLSVYEMTKAEHEKLDEIIDYLAEQSKNNEATLLFKKIQEYEAVLQKMNDPKYKNRRKTLEILLKRIKTYFEDIKRDYERMISQGPNNNDDFEDR